MSKIARKPLSIPQGVTVSVDLRFVRVAGPKGNVAVPLLPTTACEVTENSVRITSSGSFKQARANWGTMAAHLKNALIGVSEGFQKKLSIEGIGYRASLEGKRLVLAVGFSKPVSVEATDRVTFSIDKNVITVSGVDRTLVGQVAANIRKVKKPEPYKGKGIRYEDEVVRRKAGKKVVSASE